MEYREHAVPRSLARHLQCVWQLRAPALPGAVQTIYPDGRCELVVHFGQPPQCWSEALGWQRQARTLFAAQRVGAVRLAGRAAIDCLGIRLMPAASGLVAPRRLAQFRDRIVDLAAVDATLARALPGAARRFARGEAGALWQLLQARCAGHSVDERVAIACARLEASKGRTRIDALAPAAGLSLRALQVRFARGVGLHPKEFARLARLQAMLRALDAGNCAIAALALDAGFSDQAHATRELRRVTGVTPARLRAALRGNRDGELAIRLAAAFVRGGAR